MIFRKILLLISIIFLGGCTISALVAPITTGVIYWINGEASQYYDNDLGSLYRATKHAATELGFTINKDTKVSDEEYYLEAGDKNQFHIVIKKVDSKINVVKIRVNFMGDKEYALLMYSKIDEQLNIIRFDEKGVPTKKIKIIQR